MRGGPRSGLDSGCRSILRNPVVVKILTFIGVEIPHAISPMSCLEFVPFIFRRLKKTGSRRVKLKLPGTSHASTPAKNSSDTLPKRVLRDRFSVDQSSMR